jgi:hypothetical protein
MALCGLSLAAQAANKPKVALMSSLKVISIDLEFLLNRPVRG